MLPPGLLMIHDTPGGGEDHVAELSGGQKVVGPLLYLSDGHVKSGGDHSALVQTTSQIDNDLSGSVVIHNLSSENIYKLGTFTLTIFCKS